MDKSQNKQLVSIFAKCIGIPEKSVKPTLSYENTAEWDSLKHLQMISDVEEVFDIEIDMDDVIAMEDFEKVQQIVSKYLN